VSLKQTLIKRLIASQKKGVKRLSATVMQNKQCLLPSSDCIYIYIYSNWKFAF